MHIRYIDLSGATPRVFSSQNRTSTPDMMLALTTTIPGKIFQVGMVQKTQKILKSFLRKLLPATISISLAGSLSIGIARAQSLNGDETSKLKLLEQNFFFKNYEDDSAETRLGRIEKRVFGDLAEGSLSERLAHIMQVAKPVEKALPGASAPGGTNRGNVTVTPAAKTPEQIQQEEQLKREDEADRARRRAMEARDEEVNQMSADAIRLWKERKGPEALEKFEQVVRLAPDNAEAHFSLGVIYEAQRNFSEALSSYRKALEIDPNKREYREAVALVEKKAVSQGQEDGKKKELRELAENASGAYSRGEFISALELYKQLDKKAPNQPQLKYNIATIYLAMKNPVQALDFLRQARKLKPDEPSYQRACAQLEGNLQAEENERMNAERAWQQSQQDNNQGNKRPDNGNNQNQQNPNQQYQQDPNQQNSAQSNQKKQKQKHSRNDAENGGTFVNNNGSGNGLMGGEQGSGPPSSAFGILAKKAHEGVMVTTIGIASRAAKCGLQKGDVIRAVDGVVLQNEKQFQDVMAGKRPGQSIQLLIERKGSVGQIIL